MQFNPDEYVGLAHSLVDAHGKYEPPKGSRFSTQAALRAAISRAYYGAWLRAREFSGLATRRDDRESHQAVIKYYENRAEADSKTIAGLLMDLKSLRRKADYQTDTRLSLREAKDALASADEVLETLEKKKSA
jgi:uncharacterized protein (UPF0332 family)